MSRYRDFDLAKQENEPIEWSVNGERYQISGDPPAGPILQVLAEDRLNDPTAAMEILNALVGEENLARMVEGGLGLRQMSELVDYIMQELGFATDAAAGTLEDPALATADAGNG